MNVRLASGLSHAFFLWLLIQVTLSLPYVPYNGYEIKDLNSTGACFISQIGTWSASNLRTTQKYTVCGSEYLLGGYDILRSPNDYFYKQYTGLPTHSMIYYTMTIYAIDSWDAPDYFTIDFDGHQFAGPTLTGAVFVGKLCGNINYNDGGSIRVFGRVVHSDPTLTLRMIHSLDNAASDESFGFRNVNLLFTNTPDTTNTLSSVESFCALAHKSFTLTNKQCACAEGQFQYTTSPYACVNCHPACSSCYAAGPNNCYQCAPGASFVNGQCIYCDASCQVCSGPGPTECTTCQPGLFLFQGRCISECALPATSSTDGCINSCSAPCSTSTDFLYWDGVCRSSCAFPLRQITTSASIRKCVNPCGTGEYLYWDGSCEKSCASPLSSSTTLGVQYCNFPCSSSTLFLYWNNTCDATCNFPLVQYFDKERQFCRYECSSSEYLNYDGSCVASCDSPLIMNTIAGLKYCQFPCPDSSYFLYWNNTCQTSCFPPLKTYSVGKLSYCAPTCLASQYLLWNGTCIDSCPLPATIQSSYYGTLCILPCANPLDYYDEETGTCDSVCHSHSVVESDLFFKCLGAPSVTSFGPVVKLLLESSASPGMVTFLTVAKLAQPIRYISVSLPSRLENLIQNKGRKFLSLELGFKMPSSLQEKFHLETIATVFQKQGLHSSFLVNFWQDLSSMWIAIGLLISVLIVKLLSKIFNWKFAEYLCDSFSYIVRWNLILILLAIDIDDVALFASLEFRTFRGGSAAAIWSLLICIFMIILMNVFLFGTFFLASRARNLKNNQNMNTPSESMSYRIFVIKWESCQVLFSGYNNGRYFTHLFYFFYMVRLATPMVIAAAYYTLPMMQATAYFFMSCVTVSYIAFAQPIKSKVSQAQVLTIESLVLVIYFGVFLLAILDQTDVESSLASIVIGDIIILANLAINLLLVIFLAVKIGVQIKVILDLGKRQATKQKPAWFQLVFLVIQQCGMGFEKAKSINVPNMVKEEQSALLKKLQKLGLKNNNNASLASERASGADSTIAGSTARDTNGFNNRKDDVVAVNNMNEEIITFIDSTTGPLNMNTSQISFVGLGGNETIGDAFPINKIVDRSVAENNFRSSSRSGRIYPEISPKFSTNAGSQQGSFDGTWRSQKPFFDNTFTK